MATSEKQQFFFNPTRMAKLETQLFQDEVDDRPLGAFNQAVAMVQEQFHIPETTAVAIQAKYDDFVAAFRTYLLDIRGQSVAMDLAGFEYATQLLAVYHKSLMQEIGTAYNINSAVDAEWGILMNFLLGNIKGAIHDTGALYSTIYQIPLKLVMPATEARERALAVLRGIKPELPATEASWTAIHESLLEYYTLLELALENFSSSAVA